MSKPEPKKLTDKAIDRAKRREVAAEIVGLTWALARESEIERLVRAHDYEALVSMLGFWRDMSEAEKGEAAARRVMRRPIVPIVVPGVERGADGLPRRLHL